MNGTGLNLYNDKDLAGCAAWIVRFQSQVTTITYKKLRTNATVNDVIGTYVLDGIDGGDQQSCVGASASATITVSA